VNASSSSGGGAANSPTWLTPDSSRFSPTRTTGRGYEGGVHLVTQAEVYRHSPHTNWPTPVANDDNKSLEAHLAMKKRIGERDGTHANRTAVTSLSVMARHWATPCVPNGGRINREEVVAAGGRMPEGKKQITLEAQSRYWPTPNATDHKGSSTRAEGKERPECDDDLPTRLERLGESYPFSPQDPSNANGGQESSGSPPNSCLQWPTPNAAGGTGYMSGSNRDTWRPTLEGMAQGHLPELHRGRPKRDQAKKRLNPFFVEWLMGWPIGLSIASTDFARAATGSYPCRPLSPSASSHNRSWRSAMTAALDGRLAILEQGSPACAASSVT
jgi:hypothetical protein